MYNSEKAAQFDVNLCMQMNSPKPMVVVFGNFKPSFDVSLTVLFFFANGPYSPVSTVS